MKLQCILLTLAVVNFSPIMTADYANSVYITNKYIEKVYDEDAAGLETAISNIVNGNANMVTVNLMLAVPEAATIFNIAHDEVFGAEFIENLPETIAIADQLAVREAIQQVTNISVPQLGPNENIENDALLPLGVVRRLIMRKVIKKLFLDAKQRGSPEFQNLFEICRLLGLMKSIKFPGSYIKTATVSGNDCTLISHINGFRYHRISVGRINVEYPLQPGYGFIDNLPFGPGF